MGAHPPPPAIPGIKAEGQLLHKLRQEVASLLNRKSYGFPGAQPVSFAARHLQELQRQDYYVCEKSDGIRCLMYLTYDNEREVTYLINRKNDYYWVKDLHFPLPDAEADFYTGTVVDGELVNDREPDGSIKLRYLVFDCLVLSEASLMHRTLDKRLAYYKDKIFDPYHTLYKKYPQEKQYLPFVVEFKRMERCYGIEMLFRAILPKLAHGSDGLIFTCRNTPYKFGTDPNILKWKPANENSVDFRLFLEVPTCEPDTEDEDDGLTNSYPDYSAIPGLRLTVSGDGGRDMEYGRMFATVTEWEHIKALGKPMDEAIVECYQDDDRRWRFMRIRDDKHDPNHISTVESVLESIQDRVSEDDLIAIGPRIREAWKLREAAETSSLPGKPGGPLSTTTVEGGQPIPGASGSSTTGQKRKLLDNETLVPAADPTSKRRLTSQPL